MTTVAIYENYVYEGVGCIYGDIAISPALVRTLCTWLPFFFLFSYRPFGLWMFFISVILMTCIFLQLINNMKRDASRLSSSYSSSKSRVSAHSNPSKKSSSSSQAYYLWLLRAVVNYLIKMSCCSVNLIYDLILLSLSLILLFWTIIGSTALHWKAIAIATFCWLVNFFIVISND